MMPVRFNCESEIAKVAAKVVPSADDAASEKLPVNPEESVFAFKSNIPTGVGLAPPPPFSLAKKILDPSGMEASAAKPVEKMMSVPSAAQPATPTQDRLPVSRLIRCRSPLPSDAVQLISTSIR